MTRRTALALATSIALATAGATFAAGTTLGLFGAARSHSGPTGNLSPVADAPQENTPRVQTVYVDVTAPPDAPATGAARRPAGRPAAPPAVAPAQPPVETVVVYDPAPTPTVTAEHDDSEHQSAEPSDGIEGDD